MSQIGVIMFTENPFASLSAFLPSLVMQIYIVVMALAVIAGTLVDISHKGSAKFFAQRRKKAVADAKRQLSGVHSAALAAKTLGEAAVSGEFCKWQRRTSHLLMMYGFLLYVVSTVFLVFVDPTVVDTPALWPALWSTGALSIVVGGLWFFFFLRVNVAYDGDPPFHLGRADLFVVSLIGSASFALIWQGAQTISVNSPVSLLFFSLYIFFTTLLFTSVFWSKFAHMFYKPVVAFQRRVEEASGASDLPMSSHNSH